MTSKPSTAQASKFMSYALRHAPESLELNMDPHGWVAVEDLVTCSADQVPLTVELILEVVRTSDKQRFSLSNENLSIRANQGHSVDVDLQLLPQEPPGVLFHGTAERFATSIQQTGLRRGERRHVHLSDNLDTALDVGRRHGSPVVFSIDASAAAAKTPFYQSQNGVWLVEHIAPEHLKLVAKP